MKAGDAYLIAFEYTRGLPHLWIVVAGPDLQGRIILVSVTTLRSWRDQTMILQPGDHPYVRHPSVIFYKFAMESNAGTLQQWIDTGRADPQAACSAELLKLIQQGITASKSTPIGILKLFRAIKKE
jgi:hypothetical protein